MDLSVIQTSEELDALEKDWRDLFQRAFHPHFFQSFDWLSRVWKHVASEQGHKLFLVVGKRGERVELIWPLQKEGRRVRLLCSDKMEYRGPLVTDRPQAMDWLEQAWEFLRKSPALSADLFVFQQVLSNSLLGQFLKNRIPDHRQIEQVSRFVNFSRFSTWDDYLKTLPKKMLSDQRRQWRRLGELGDPVNFELIPQKASEVKKEIDWLLQQKSVWLTRKGKREDHFVSEQYNKFINSAVKETSSEQFDVLLCRINIGDRTISAGYGFNNNGNFTFHMFSYDYEFEKYSPGRLLLEKLLLWCFENGVHHFDFMPGPEGYKKIWTNDTFTMNSYMIPNTFYGLLYIKLMKMRKVKSIKQKLVGRIHERLHKTRPFNR
ncbi:GNAT family N-acetyltransferase [Magnetospira sp. QH-2]|uniref:GNAT family N-acetyltransferase n=1 Tax=Magnetospira sp. (strain QH-2) TaxID=1288970 RepID=UPI0011DE4042|nr:GNAT family N-acetyltransferase [Magnetospira sp. QH-2]